MRIRSNASLCFNFKPKTPTLNGDNVNNMNSFKATKSCVTCGSINLTTSLKLSDVIFCL